jgi:1-acyl-sn-glycerol-3-phosphate acyltransferase
MAISSYLLKLAGWKVIGDFPKEKKFVIVSVPHTSMWDFVLGRLFLYQYPIKPKFLIKKELFFFPFGFLVKCMGGIPVDRSQKTDIVERLIAMYNHSDEMMLAITPEGTRKHVTEWKPGFYYIAKGANVPILPSYFDYKNKIICMGDVFYASENIEDDIKHIKDFAKNAQPKHHEKYAY